MNKKCILYTIVALFLSVEILYAQTENSNRDVALKDVLIRVEKTYGVVFSFADRDITGIRIAMPELESQLSAILLYLKNKTDLHFEQIGNTVVVIQRFANPENMTMQVLEEVVISRYLTKGIFVKSGGIKNIRTQDFGILPGLIEPDVLQTIQALPGINSIDERISNLNIRGGTHDQNLMLWDGIKMYQSGHFFGLISAFNPYLTTDVVVTKNGTPSKYGDWVSSLIDMRSDNIVHPETKGGGGINLIHADAFAHIPISESMEVQVSARRSLTDLLSSPTYESYFKRIFQDTDLTSDTSLKQDESFYFYDGTVKWLYDISERDKIRVNGLTFYNDLNYLESSRINNVDEQLNSTLTQRNSAFGITYEHIFHSKLRATAEFYFSNYNLFATNFDVINEQRLIQENEVLDTSGRLEVDYQIEDGLRYHGGYQYNEIGISNLEDVNNPAFRRFIKEVLRTHALYHEIVFKSPSRNTYARFGLRTNYIEKFGRLFIEPRFSFSQKFLDVFRFELLGELKSQYTSQIIDLQNDFLGVEKRRWILANDADIPIIQSEQLSAELHYKLQNTLISLEGYLKEVDGITTRSQGFQNQFQFVNAIGQYAVQGLDLLLYHEFSRANFWFSYSFQNNDYNFKDLNGGVSFPNNTEISHAVALAGTLDLNRLKISGGMNWRTGKPYTRPAIEGPASGATIIFEDPNSSNLNDYLRVDLSATYDMRLGEKTTAKAGLAIWNLLDKENILNRYFVVGQDQSVNAVENYSLGITPNFTFRVHFN